MSYIEIDEKPELNTDQVRKMETFDRNEAGMFNNYFQILLSNDKVLNERIKEMEPITNTELDEICV